MTLLEYIAGQPTVFLSACLVLGLIVGSFLNVVIYRLPQQVIKIILAMFDLKYLNVSNIILNFDMIVSIY